MSAERAPLCHGLAVMTGLLTYLGSLAIHGLERGDLAAAFAREAVDVAALLVFRAAGLLSGRGPARLSRPRAQLALEPGDARDPFGLHAAVRRQRA